MRRRSASSPDTTELTSVRPVSLSCSNAIAALVSWRLEWEDIVVGWAFEGSGGGGEGEEEEWVECEVRGARRKVGDGNEEGQERPYQYRISARVEAAQRSLRLEKAAVLWSYFQT